MTYRYLGLRIAQGLQVIALFVLGLAGLGLLIFTGLSALGIMPWLTFTADFEGVSFIYAGHATQIGVTTLLLMLFFFIPSQTRLLSLEQSHRNFHISMDDVSRAYHLCHTADRAGLFTASSEFDEVRERLTFLRDHPDLAELETDILTVAAQMSQQSKRLADVYSDEKVARARDFLRQRQAEAENQQARIVEALHVCREIRKWAKQVEVEESIVASQLAQLDKQLQSALPALGYSFEVTEEEEAAVDQRLLAPPAPSLPKAGAAKDRATKDRAATNSGNTAPRPMRPDNVVALAPRAAE
ncbi:MAG: DNA repair protein [Flavimaricola sp.]|nr:DNA repair protein [Flavimaricola sp.]